MKPHSLKQTAPARGRRFVPAAVACVMVFFQRSALHGGIYGTVNLPDASVSGMGGDRAWSGLPLISCRLSGLVLDGKIQCLLDIRAPRVLDAIVILNATNAASNQNVDKAIVLVAPDEHAPGFNYTNEACYTVQVFSNAVSPRSNAAGVWRTAALEKRLKRRYFLIQHTHSLWGVVENPDNPNTNEIRFHDITYRLAPPSGTVVLVR